MDFRLRNQRTLRQPAGCFGIGLHSGMIVNLRLEPLPPASGVLFQRSDLPGLPVVPASIRHVKSTHFATTLEAKGVGVGTVEHLLAACAGLGVDNLLIQVDGPEIPIMDGSALPFVDLIRNTGLTDQGVVQPYLRILRPVEIVEGEKAAGFYPAEGTQITCRIAFDHPLIGEQRQSYRHDERDFAREIGPARTFGLRKDVEALLEHGLARGGSPDNAVVLSDEGVINEGGLRFRDEFVRHKILDCVGDMALLGYPVLGHLVAIRSGHQLHARLMQRLLQETDAWQLLTEREVELSPAPLTVPSILTRSAEL